MRQVLRWALVAIVLATAVTWASDDWKKAVVTVLILAALEILYRIYLRPTGPKRRLSN